MFCEGLLDRKREIVPLPFGSYQFSLNLAERGLQSSFYYFLPEYYESETQRYIRHSVRPGMITVDVGAHVGLLTVLLAYQVGPHGKVYSFEPEAKNFLSLKRNLELNHLTWVSPLPVALSNRTGEDVLVINLSDAGAALKEVLGTRQRPADISQEKVQTMTLDDFVEREGIRKIDLIKIDAEESEPLVLEGGKRTFEKGIVSEAICEIHSSHKQHTAGRDCVRKAFYAHGYKSFVLNPALSKKSFLAELFPDEPVEGLQNILFQKEK